jgi:sugar/nucleoside kinase (ribokinase family)
MQAIVFGNVTLDVICATVDDVPRHESISFDEAAVTPGGCASNTAIGLASLGVTTGLVALTGMDDSADLLDRYWRRVGIDTRFVQRSDKNSTAVSIGLVDSDYQPRFVHTPGANGKLSADHLDVKAICETGARHLHVAGFFVLPSLMDERFGEKMSQIKTAGMSTSLDVVFNVRMDNPDLRRALWSALPHLDYFTCNAYESFRLTGEEDPIKAAAALKQRGACNVIVKLGADGCWVEGDAFCGQVPVPRVKKVIDTTGAGDAFTAGLIAALLGGENLEAACQAGNQAGAKMITALGAIAGWMEK